MFQYYYSDYNTNKNMLGFSRMIMNWFIGIMILMQMLSKSGYTRHKASALSMQYYVMTCPMVEMIVRNEVSRALQDDPTMAAPLLRLHFHDCWIEGCDASILIDSTDDNKAEKDSPGNLSLRGYEVIDNIKDELEEQCPGVVSCADIIAMAARDAVFLSGGPIYDIPKGRKDGRRSKIEDTVNLPFPSFNSSQLINVFAKRGFSVQDLIALSGAHTLGVARCSSFKQRLTKYDTTHDIDPSIDANFARTLIKTCSNGDNAQQPFDETRNDFDNIYFNDLQNKAGVLTSDQTLFDSPRTRGLVNRYAFNEAMFFLDFQRAMVKMSLLDVKEGVKGEVRRDCRKIN
ncbi:hypothetical protein RND81_04G215000 [Saponaria officinalis]|uniref:Peroxidase n=1 Tax=Saponaria officinalis TaxID=3572 RepID=A0AAW1LPD3_SAPOF